MYKKPFFIIIFFFLFIPTLDSLVFAQDSFRIPKNQQGGIEIDRHDECRIVINNRTDYDIFVPVKTKSEWDNFRIHHPENVALNECMTIMVLYDYGEENVDWNLNGYVSGGYLSGGWRATKENDHFLLEAWCPQVAACSYTTAFAISEAIDLTNFNTLGISWQFLDGNGGYGFGIYSAESGNLFDIGSGPAQRSLDKTMDDFDISSYDDEWQVYVAVQAPWSSGISIKTFKIWLE